ncbi:MAG: DUF1684 domain-containing protein [Euryarchaeota archaeon]|nr:DUF1684 domain-containing protein [Euryarchaeota archaeon]
MAGWYVSRVESLRKEKDEAFKSAPWSPIPASERAAFHGLRYFPVDERLRFRLKLDRNAAGERIEMGTSDGDVREYEKYGRLRFELDGVECVLQGYVSPERTRDTLFIAFRDLTSGKETYGAARYLDLEMSSDDHFELDFNAAYNPYCAYNEDYSCPLAPMENWLKVGIPAGEKLYK